MARDSSLGGGRRGGAQRWPCTWGGASQSLGLPCVEGSVLRASHSVQGPRLGAFLGVKASGLPAVSAWAGEGQG